MQQNDRFKNSDSNGSEYGSNGQRNGNSTFRNRGQGQGNFRGTLYGKGREEVDLTKVQMSDVQE